MPYHYTWDALRRPARYAPLAAEARPRFEPGIEQFSPVTAWWMCGFSHLAYYQPEPIAQTLEAIGMRLTAAFDIRGMQGFSARGEIDGQPIGLLSLRGASLQEWDDLRMTLDLFPRQLASRECVHRGFDRASRLIWPLVQRHIDALCRDGIPLYYTGHSLGGAMSIVSEILQPASAVYTFGTPRVGNRAFCASIAGLNIYRVVNCADIVSRLPPQWLFGYRHLRNLYFLNHDGQLQHNPAAAEISRQIRLGRKAYRQVRVHDKVWLRDLADHTIMNYSEGLLRAARLDAAGK